MLQKALFLVIVFMSTVFIYTLEHPETGEIRYVGKTNNLASRLSGHINESRCALNHKAHWISSLKKQGLVPIMNVLDEVPEEEWKFWEIHWISAAKAWGFGLCNADGGGHGQGGVSIEARQKQSKAKLGKPAVHRHVAYAQYTPDGVYIRSFSGGPAMAKAMGCPAAYMQRAATRCLLAAGFRWFKLTGEPPTTIPSKYNAEGKTARTIKERILINKKQFASRIAYKELREKLGVTVNSMPHGNLRRELLLSAC